MPGTINIERDFKRKVCDTLSVQSEGKDRYIVSTPMTFEDGDKLPIVLKKEEDRWLLSDEGHTFMQLTYDLDESDLSDGTRHEVIERTISAFQLKNRQGELILPIEDERYGDSLYSFIQALLKIDDVRYLSRERVQSTFYGDFKRFVEKIIPEKRRSHKWHEHSRDPQANYEVDYRLNGTETPLFVFALDTENKIRDATISLHTFEKWGLKFNSVGIFEDQEGVNRKVLARFLDICGKSFSNLASTEERFEKTFPDFIRESAPTKT